MNYNFSIFLLSVCIVCCIVSYLFVYACLCDRVDNVTFEPNQEQAYEEENQQLLEEGKWISPSAYSI
jgi:hypothetical protein